MKPYFTAIEGILYERDLKAKFEKFAHFYEDFKSLKFSFDFEREVLLDSTLPPNLRVKEPVKIRRVKSPSSDEALAKMLHSIAHIEFCAVNLALDSAYRFRDLPREFYAEWLEVADEEIKHFRLLERGLNELGFAYGDFAVHLNLLDALNATAHSLKYRMGVVHRGLEAKGLDANPFVVAKLQGSNHKIKPYLIEILGIILNDEIKHVRKGDKWWLYANSLAQNAENSALARISAKNDILKSHESVDFSAENGTFKSRESKNLFSKNAKFKRNESEDLSSKNSKFKDNESNNFLTKNAKFKSNESDNFSAKNSEFISTAKNDFSNKKAKFNAKNEIFLSKNDSILISANNDFIALCAKFPQFTLAGRILNKNARLKAGFTPLELLQIEAFYAKSEVKKI